jgi:hypothetical protein
MRAFRADDRQVGNYNGRLLGSVDLQVDLQVGLQMDLIQSPLIGCHLIGCHLIGCLVANK